MIGHGVVVDLAQRAFLRAHQAGHGALPQAFIDFLLQPEAMAAARDWLAGRRLSQADLMAAAMYTRLTLSRFLQ